MGDQADNAQPAPMSGLERMRLPFKAGQISKLPKPTRAQSDALKADAKIGIRCPDCGGWHHPKVVHLDYVGHAALTERLLECDPCWNWEPMARAPDGTPLIDRNGGMWINLTVCGVTRPGYGHADGKAGGDAIKEVIGDALRNAAMRFGAALDLWHKGDLHAKSDDEEAAPRPARQEKPAVAPEPAEIAIKSLTGAEGMDALSAIWRGLPPAVRALPAVVAAKDTRKAALTVDDAIPY